MGPDPKDSFFTLSSGEFFHPFAPREDKICIEDIAAALSKICRFNGHSAKHYSVAQHSVLVSMYVPQEDALCGLMHDATEAYVGDMITPIKKFMPDFNLLESNVWSVISAKFKLPAELPASVLYADRAVLKAEGRDLLRPFGVDKFGYLAIESAAGLVVYDPARNIEPLSPEQAEASFLSRFRELTS